MQNPADYRLSAQEVDGTLAIAVGGRVDIGNVQRLFDEIMSRLRPRPREVTLDLAEVNYFDSSGAAALINLRQHLDAAQVPLRIVRSTPNIDQLFALVDEKAVLAASMPPAHLEPNLAVRAGAATLQALSDFRELVVFTGEIILGLREAAFQPSRIRWRETWLYMARTGVDAIPIVGLISFLMGLIMGFQAAVQMSQFGADIYVANLVGLAIVRELGPLMTAIVVAGRSGAAFAAEIGTMEVSEEVDALTVMGLDRTRFLVTPKVVALLLMLPCLSLMADVVGVLGGLTVGVVWLDLPLQVYMRQTRLAMDPMDVLSGLVKTLAFAILIAGVGCLRGFQAQGGADSVGRVTTSAVVSGIFFIILADAVFTVLFHYW